MPTSVRVNLAWLRLPLAAVAAVGLVSCQSAAQSGAQTLDSVVQHVLNERRGRRDVEQRALGRLYPRDDARPLWIGATGPTAQAMQVIDALTSAPARGLRAPDYDGDGLRATATMLLGLSSTDAVGATRFDVALSEAAVRFVADLHLGRVEPNAMRFDLPDSHEDLDLAAMVLAVSHASDVAAAIGAAEPPFAGYVALRRALAGYRALAADSTLRPPAAAPGSVHPGDRYADLPMLRRLLVALGDLAATESTVVDTAEHTYAGAIVAALAAFQERHGLEPDSIIGPATLAQLRVPLSRRVEQIELTLERWRWLPDRPPARYAVVNVPAFRLSVFEDDSIAQAPALSMKVIVGEAEGRHDTPVFSGTMREIVLNPYWDVPLRIAQRELVPLFRRSLSVFVRDSFEIVRGSDDDAVVYPPTAANLARVAAGTLLLRQRPGPANALGAVKFVFPNRYNVYLHGTSAPELFAASKRDFSHGCIRVEKPVALAELVLRRQAPWNRAAIDSAIDAKRTRRIRLEQPVEVFVLYGTVAVRGGVVHFYRDLYGHDRALARALDARATPPSP